MPRCIVAPTGVVGGSQAHPHEGADGSTQNTPGEASGRKDPHGHRIVLHRFN